MSYIDVNGDGIADALVTNRYRRRYIDINGDGIPDKVVYSFPRPPLRTFSPRVYQNVMPRPTRTYTDYTGDGFADIVSTDYNGDGVSDAVAYYPPPSPATTYTDWDGDGFADEVSVDYNNDGIPDAVRRY